MKVETSRYVVIDDQIGVDELLARWVAGEKTAVLDALEADHPALAAAFVVKLIDESRFVSAASQVVEQLLARRAQLLATQPLAYDPGFGDGRLCKCGHTYDRHFDPYEDNEPVGCKYCCCDVWEPPPDVDYGDPTLADKRPERTPMDTWAWWCDRLGGPPDLPPSLFELLCDHQRKSDVRCDYATFDDAVTALRQAVVRKAGG